MPRRSRRRQGSSGDGPSGRIVARGPRAVLRAQDPEERTARLQDGYHEGHDDQDVSAGRDRLGPDEGAGGDVSHLAGLRRRGTRNYRETADRNFDRTLTTPLPGHTTLPLEAAPPVERGLKPAPTRFKSELRRFPVSSTITSQIVKKILQNA